ncbi:MAG: NAD-dependent epimerase/dehydratase family protein [Cryobacterium sp.]|nr:NAD-dependent epimerase/dehydratase family protein [Cryobacterium sp.]
MASILVTGGTGKLGTPTVAQLRKAGHDVRVLSRRTGPGLTTGNLVTGEGLSQALDGVHTVVHLATGRKDVQAAGTLLAQCKAAGIGHIVYMSIVGVERIPLGYYRGKLAIERLVAQSGLPHTILRATQFHNLVDGMFTAQRFSPVLLAPKFALQPIDTADVAARLTELCGSDAAGRVADIGGPQRRTARDLAAAWSKFAHSRRPIWPLWLPGKTFAGYAAGHNLVPGEPYGKRTFEEYLADRYEGRA